MRPWRGPARSLARIHHRRVKTSPIHRLATTAILAETPPPSPSLLLDEIQTLLQRDFVGLDIWNERLRRGIEDSRAPRRRRIGVWGTEFSGRTDVAAALAQDVLSGTDVRQLLHSRETRTDQSSITIGSDPSDDIIVSSPWLQSLDLHIWEVTDEDPSAALSTLLQCDIILLVVDPFTLVDSVPQTLRIPNSHLVINGPLPPGVSEAALVAKLNRQGVPRASISFTQAASAIAAVESFNDPQTSSRTLDIFQQRFMSSGIGRLQRAIASNLPDRLDTLYRLAESILTAMDETVAFDLDHNAVSEGRGAELLSETSDPSINGPDFGESVAATIASARQELDRGFVSRWTWLNLVLKTRIDDCGREAADTIRRLVGNDVGAQLAFELGRLDQLQRQWTQRADQSLRDAIKVERQTSSSTANALAILSRSSDRIETRSLIMSPHQQFLPLVAHLQRSAERAALVMWTAGVSSVGLSWLGANLDVTSATNAVTASILGVLVSLRIGQQLWHRAQRRFKNDWDRVAVLTAEELSSRITTLADAAVTARPKAVSRALLNMAQSRKIRLQAVQDRIQGLRQQDMHMR